MFQLITSARVFQTFFIELTGCILKEANEQTSRFTEYKTLQAMFPLVTSAHVVKLLPLSLSSITDLFSLSVLLPHFRPLDVPWRFILLSILKLIIQMHANIWEFESNVSLGYHHVV